MKSIKGRTAVITGAASGIGLALAERLARKGAKVVLSDVQQGRLDAAANAIRSKGGEALGVVTDVSDAGSVAALAARRGRPTERRICCSPTPAWSPTGPSGSNPWTTGAGRSG
ncbi:MAG: SDR family NAD(P)-dependent oxidoreductase [Caulobacteraceae bacterium]|nr:SDR family NAD(P)-dependent oxidoreductase [Caulobacteraceae bacterium]